MKREISFVLRYGYSADLEYADVGEFKTLAEAQNRCTELQLEEKKYGRDLKYQIIKTTEVVVEEKRK